MIVLRLHHAPVALSCEKGCQMLRNMSYIIVAYTILPSLNLRTIANNCHLVVCAVHQLCTPSLIPTSPNDRSHVPKSNAVKAMP
jgi:hypothetical protein